MAYILHRFLAMVFVCGFFMTPPHSEYVCPKIYVQPVERSRIKLLNRPKASKERRVHRVIKESRSEGESEERRERGTSRTYTMPPIILYDHQILNLSIRSP